ncbi:hypothetical protein I4U23_017285 [Adineta vaga]|nr:hypothetical protein I4U23_017285 [Adineta vaga]
MFWIIFIFSLFSTIDSIRIGKIEDRIMIGIISNNFLFNISKIECICQMMKLNGTIIALNYFQINNTCQLFISNNNSFLIQYNSNSSFIFINQSSISITVSQTNVICNVTCQNNGTCSSNVCICTSQWTGTQCEIPICSTPCANSGICTSPNVCTCYYGWQGSYCQTVKTVLWSFDNTLDDATSQFHGISSNSPTYTTGINGYGSALVLNGNINQCVIVYPYLNMSYISFTWQFWIYPTVTPTGDSMFIGQCSQPTSDQCLLFMTRNDIMLFAFWGDDIVGSKNISANKWAHMTFVYDYSLNKKFIYLNGILEASSNSIGPLQVNSTNMTFGCSTINGGSSYASAFIGYIDQMLFNSRVKNTSEILDDATLVFYYRFLSTSPLFDSGPNYINGSFGGNTTLVTSGIVNQGINFPVNRSYFQITKLVLLGTPNWPFSLSLWFKTNSLKGGGTIAHLSSDTSGTGWCIRFIGLSANGTIQVQIYGGTNTVINGPVMPVGVWTHVVYTFSTTNGIRLFVNGTFANSFMTSYSASNSPVTLTFGNPLLGTSCGSSFPNQQFYGSIDEVRLYSRELTTNEVLQLYINP